MEGDSDMEISDDDRPLPSSVGSCLQTHPPSHQEAHDFLSSLLLAPDGEGVWTGDGTVADEGVGVCPGPRPVDTAGGDLVATIPDVAPLHDTSLSLHGHALGPAAPVEDPAAATRPGGVGAGGTSAVPDGGSSHLSGHSLGGAVGPSYRQRQQSRSHRRQLAKRNAATAASFLR
jgi:hypothetical protein